MGAAFPVGNGRAPPPPDPKKSSGTPPRAWGGFAPRPGPPPPPVRGASWQSSSARAGDSRPPAETPDHDPCHHRRPPAAAAPPWAGMAGGESSRPAIRRRCGFVGTGGPGPKDREEGAAGNPPAPAREGCGTPAKTRAPPPTPMPREPEPQGTLGPGRCVGRGGGFRRGRPTAGSVPGPSRPPRDRPFLSSTGRRRRRPLVPWDRRKPGPGSPREGRGAGAAILRSRPALRPEGLDAGDDPSAPPTGVADGRAFRGGGPEPEPSAQLSPVGGVSDHPRGFK